MQKEAVSIRVMETDPIITSINNYLVTMVTVFYHFSSGGSSWLATIIQLAVIAGIIYCCLGACFGPRRSVYPTKWIDGWMDLCKQE